MQKRIAEWNTQKKIWQTLGEDTLLPQSELYSGPWPTSGMMQGGSLYELPTQEPPTGEKEFSLLPTPVTRDHKDGSRPYYRHGVLQVDTVTRAIVTADEVTETEWGKYETAVKTWEKVTGRPAPTPIRKDARNGDFRVTKEFFEWMMGVPEGWIVDTKISRSSVLKACGNGVVPQQAELALKLLLPEKML